MVLSPDILPSSSCFQRKDTSCCVWPLQVQYPSMDLSSFNLFSLFLSPGKILQSYHPLALNATDRLSVELQLLPLICSEHGSCQLHILILVLGETANNKQQSPFHPLCVTHHHSVDLNFSFRQLFLFSRPKSPLCLLSNFFIGGIFSI